MLNLTHALHLLRSMATKSIRFPSALYLPYVCERCALRLRTSTTAKRWATTAQSLPKDEVAEDQDEKAVHNSQQAGLMSVLQERGYINQIAG